MLGVLFVMVIFMIYRNYEADLLQLKKIKGKKRTIFITILKAAKVSTVRTLLSLSSRRLHNCIVRNEYFYTLSMFDVKYCNLEYSLPSHQVLLAL